jgi:formylmethanofuran dehydrogenase subunit E
MGTTISPEQVEATISFHGHWCPGLAMGIRAAEMALRDFGKAGDEEIVAVVETDMCGVDAVQFLTGCTFGKGNLIYRDHGKNAFTFYRRRDNKSARLVARPGRFADAMPELGVLSAKKEKEGLTPEEKVQWKNLREELSKRIMDADLEDLFEVKEPTWRIPRKARLLTTLVCDDCGEPVMESRTRRLQERTLCIPCFEKLDNQM